MPKVSIIQSEKGALMVRLYRLRDVARITEGYATTGVALAGSLVLGNPVTAATAVGLTALAGFVGLRSQKKYMKKS